MGCIGGTRPRRRATVAAIDLLGTPLVLAYEKVNIRTAMWLHSMIVDMSPDYCLPHIFTDPLTIKLHCALTQHSLAKSDRPKFQE